MAQVERGEGDGQKTETSLYKSLTKLLPIFVFISLSNTYVALLHQDTFRVPNIDLIRGDTNGIFIERGKNEIDYSLRGKSNKRSSLAYEPQGVK